MNTLKGKHLRLRHSFSCGCSRRSPKTGVARLRWLDRCTANETLDSSMWPITVIIEIEEISNFRYLFLINAKECTHRLRSSDMSWRRNWSQRFSQLWSRTLPRQSFSGSCLRRRNAAFRRWFCSQIQTLQMNFKLISIERTHFASVFIPLYLCWPRIPLARICAAFHWG